MTLRSDLTRPMLSSDYCKLFLLQYLNMFNCRNEIELLPCLLFWIINHFNGHFLPLCYRMVSWMRQNESWRSLRGIDLNSSMLLYQLFNLLPDEKKFRGKASEMSLNIAYKRFIEFLQQNLCLHFLTHWTFMVGAVGKISALRPQNPQFDPRLCQDLNICETFFSAYANSACHPSGIGE